MTPYNQNPIYFLRDAAPYIQMHRGKTFVIALSGEVIKHKIAKEILQDIALLSTLGARIILVHGARSQIEDKLTAEKHPTRVHNGVRITDNRTLELSKAAIGATRLEIENLLNRALNKPPIINNSLGVVSGNFLTAKPVGVIDGVDYQHTGKIRKVKKKLIKLLLSQQNIILLSPLGYSPTGQIYNLRYEEVASATASRVNADKIIFIRNNIDLAFLPKQLNLENLKEATSITKHPILSETYKAMRLGVDRSHFIDIKVSGGLLLELYTRDGVGKMIDNNNYDKPRKASIEDIGGIFDLISPLEDKGILAKRSRKQLEIEIESFSVIERDGQIIGCAALNTFKNCDHAELSCLAVDKNYRSDSRGRQLVEHISKRATDLNIKYLFVLTTQSIDWFLELGFTTSSIEHLPEYKQKQYNQKRKSKILHRKNKVNT